MTLNTIANRSISLTLSLVLSGVALASGPGHILAIVRQDGGGHAVTALDVPPGATSANPDGVYFVRENAKPCGGVKLTLVVLGGTITCSAPKGKELCCEGYRGSSVYKIYQVAQAP